MKVQNVLLVAMVTVAITPSAVLRAGGINHGSGTDHIEGNLKENQVAHLLYDSARCHGMGTAPHPKLDQVWKDEIVDGVLNRHLWVEGIIPGMSSFSLSAGGEFLISKPGHTGAVKHLQPDVAQT